MIRGIIRNSLTVALAGGVLVCLVGCKPAPKPWAPTPGTVEFRVTQMADRVVANAYPKYDRHKYPIRLRQDADRWIFDYDLPDNMIGGTPTVVFDKKTLDIIEVYQGQ